ncbi:MAG: hypothetical protein L6R40_003804 [Gallowayella cf. fulva]|nr:MAG: hypothetical protein L6R40_003804 [Xanthomendoza cf. fulva]
MPVFTRRQHIMAETPSHEPIWIVPDGFEKSQKELDFPSASLNGKMPRRSLRINTYSNSDLHERYMSSEEEPSPSPDSSDAESTASDELKHKSSSRVLAPTDEPPLDLSSIESDATTQIAVAMPIVAYGRPKLIDITNLAPIQRRKRMIKQPVAPSTTVAKHTLARTLSAPRLTQDNPFIANEAAEMVVPAEKAAAIAQKQVVMAANRRLKEQATIPSVVSYTSSAPISWLPEEDEDQTSNSRTYEEERDYHFPSDTEADSDYGPYNLEPIQPSPHRPAHFPPPSRKRTNSNPFTIVTPTTLGKGLTKTWSIAKKGVHHASSTASSTSGPSQQTAFSSHAYPPLERQVTKKPKMIARGAKEREEALLLPPYPFEATAA